MKTMSLPSVRFEELARVSVFSGLLRVQELRERYPGVSDADLEHAAAKGSADKVAADVSTAVRLLRIIDIGPLRNDAASMRVFLDTLLDHDCPAWLSATARGRAAVASVIPPAAEQCLAFASLLSPVPDVDAVSWWDRVSSKQRAAKTDRLKDIGRLGERLTLQYEQVRLRALGVQLDPVWAALDDEWLGYDVLSFDVALDGSATNRLIEVKVCSSLPLQIFLTRNEWEQALRAKTAYVFHVWHLPSERVVELTSSDIEPHIPQDKGSGSWQQARIDVSCVTARLESSSIVS